MASLATFIAIALAMVPMDHQQITRCTPRVHQTDEMRQVHPFSQQQPDIDNPISSLREVWVTAPMCQKHLAKLAQVLPQPNHMQMLRRPTDAHLGHSVRDGPAIDLLATQLSPWDTIPQLGQSLQVSLLGIKIHLQQLGISRAGH